MNLVQQKPKKCGLPENIPLPVLLKKDNTVYKFKGVYNDVSVILENRDDMKNIISMGYFGKANLSRSYPTFSQEKVEIIRQRQYDRRKIWGKSLNAKQNKKVIVIDDSDEEQQNYFTHLQPKFEIDSSGIMEKVWLSPEEAFFLCESVKCLDIFYKKELLSCEKCWDIFSLANKYFQTNYVAYFHFRAKNWVVKPGIKFGGDYLLYKQGPPFYHATYVVVLDILDSKLQRVNYLLRRSMDNLSLHGLNRLSETAGKELLILQIILTEKFDTDIKFNYKDIGQLEVKEVLLRRWISNQENS